MNVDPERGLGTITTFNYVSLGGYCIFVSSYSGIR